MRRLLARSPWRPPPRASDSGSSSSSKWQWCDGGSGGGSSASGGGARKLVQDHAVEWRVVSYRPFRGLNVRLYFDELDVTFVVQSQQIIILRPYIPVAPGAIVRRAGC